MMVKKEEGGGEGGGDSRGMSGRRCKCKLQ